MAFDEDGRLYVVEMRWYQSETRGDLMFDERIGRIRLLEDTNGDGRFEKSTIFADRLRYPSAVFPYDGGVYVGVEPDIIYLKDRNGDGVADFRQVVFTGFGNQRDRLDSQTFMNSLTWGLDNRIHGGQGAWRHDHVRGIRRRAPLDLRGRDFSFDPRTHRMRPESGGGKQGLSFDDYGRKFVCTQTNAVQMLMYEDRYAARNPHYAPPPARVDIALEPGETNDRQLVHRISPEDPWRPHPESLARGRCVRRTAASAAGLSDRIERRDPVSRETRSRLEYRAERLCRRRRQQPGSPADARRRTAWDFAPRVRPTRPARKSSSPRPTSGSGPWPSPTDRTARSTSPICTARFSTSRTGFPNPSSGSRI